MSIRSTIQRFACCVLLVASTGCAGRPRGWGMPWGQGSTNRQTARAAVHDPFPQNDIGPEVVGGRPREFASPQAEPVRHHVTQSRYPSYR